MSGLIDYAAHEPARLRAALMIFLLGLTSQFDSLMMELGIDEFDEELGWVIENQARIEWAISAVIVLALFSYGRLSLREVVMPLLHAEEAVNDQVIWREDGGE